MRQYISLFLFFLSLSNHLNAQNKCAFYPKDTIVVNSIPEEIISNTIHLDSIPQNILIATDSFYSFLNSGAHLTKIYNDETRVNDNSIAKKYISLYTYRASPRVRIKIGAAFDSSGNIINYYGLSDSIAWLSYPKPFLSFCDASKIFNKKYPSTLTTKFQELEIKFDTDKNKYLWQMRKIKSSIINKAGDRKGVDCTLFIDAFTDEIVYENRKKISIKHSH